MNPIKAKSIVKLAVSKRKSVATRCGAAKSRRRRLIQALIGALFTLGSLPRAFALTTHYVDNIAGCAGLAPCYATIMDAVSVAVAFDTIEVFPGVYPEHVIFSGKNGVVLRARHKGRTPLTPVIKGGIRIEQSSGIQIRDFILGGVTGYGAQAAIQGNTIDGSVWLSSCSPTSVVNDNIFLGTGFECQRGGAVVEGNELRSGGISFGSASGFTLDAIVRGNLLLSGGIVLAGERVQGSIVDANKVYGGDISIGNGSPQVRTNAIQRNVVRRGGIRLAGMIQNNSIASNFVSGSTGDGILVVNMSGFGSSGVNVIKSNTSVENAGCDINETGVPGYPNVWKDNRFATRCGDAME